MSRERIFKVLILIFILFGVVNIFLQKGEFFKASLAEILTIVVTLFFGYFISENLTDKRRKISCIESVIIEIQKELMTDPEIISFDPSLNTIAYTKQVFLANRIKYLKDYNTLESINADLDFIKSHFKEIRELYSNHSGTAESLASIKDDINRHRNLINCRCDKIRLKLYS